MVGKENIKLVNFIEAFLQTPIVDRKGQSYTCQERGIPQGSPISPVLMNLYLHILDAELERVMAREDGTVRSLLLRTLGRRYGLRFTERG